MSNHDAKKKGLGRGLNALFSDSDPTETEITASKKTDGNANQNKPAPAASAANAPRKIAIANLTPGKFQPRRRFDAEPIEKLAASIALHGIIQPLLVRPNPNRAGHYEIIAGERRWRAAQKAQLHEAPVVIQELSDTAAFEIAIIENIQREDLTPLEEAEAYHRLIQEFDYTQEQLAGNVGKSRSHVANMLRLLSLPEQITLLLQNGKITMGHARALLSAADPIGIARRIVHENLSVRQVEDLASGKVKNKKKQFKEKPFAPASSATLGKDPDTVALENEMTALLGLKTEINASTDQQSGQFILHYQSLDQLDDILQRLNS